MDFINIFPIETSELIFQHLSVKDLLKISTVSTSWSSLIGKSKSLMKKVQINFDKDSQRAKIRKIFKNSSRNYQHLRIKTFKTEMINLIYEIFKTKHKHLKTLTISYYYFSDYEKIIKLIELFSESEEEITLAVNFSNRLYKLKFNEFPKLKILNILWDIECFKIFKNSKNLVELNIKSLTTSTRDTRAIVKLLHHNKNLKVLKISLNIYNEIFTDKNLTKIPFKLHTLECSNFEIVNYKKFLINQFDSLQNLRIPTVNYLQDLWIIFMMPNLKELDLGNIEQLYVNNLNFSICKNLEKLSFRDTTLSLSTFNSIANAAPNVKELQIYSLTKEIIEIISTKMTKLESLKLKTISDADLLNHQFFSKLKSCTIEVIDIQFEFEDHSNFINEFIKYFILALTMFLSTFVFYCIFRFCFKILLSFDFLKNYSCDFFNQRWTLHDFEDYLELSF